MSRLSLLIEWKMNQIHSKEKKGVLDICEKPASLNSFMISFKPTIKTTNKEDSVTLEGPAWLMSPNSSDTEIQKDYMEK